MTKTTKTPTPRKGSYYGMPISNVTFPDGGWMEGEEFAYPADGFTRRAYALCEDGKRRVVLISIPDTYFSVPARARIKGRTVKGYITCGYSEDVDHCVVKFFGVVS